MSVSHQISGKHIQSINANYLGEGASQVLWNGENKLGEKVETGVYLISSRSEAGEIKRGKLAVIRQ